MFSCCTSLKALDLSSFNTTNARDSYKTYHGDTYSAFTGMLNGLSSLESLTLGENFCFTGNGTAKAVTLPAANNAEGLWYDEEGKSYTPDTIPQKTAGIYYAVNPVQP